MVYQYQKNRLLSQKSIIRDKGGHDIFTKVSIHQVYITIISTYTANRQLPKHTKQTLTGLKGEIDSNTIILIVVDFDTPPLVIDRTTRQKISK